MTAKPGWNRKEIWPKYEVRVPRELTKWSILHEMWVPFFGGMMDKCMVCGNEYKNVIEISQQGKKYTFDCFECAIQELAPECHHCSCKIIGHGVEEDGKYFCCNHCARVQEAGN